MKITYDVLGNVDVSEKFPTSRIERLLAASLVRRVIFQGSQYLIVEFIHVHSTENIYKKELCRYNWKLPPNGGKQKKNQKKKSQSFERKVQITRHTQKEARMDRLEED